jgi:hypothetical protein
VKDIYLEEFDVVNDSVFLLTRDYLMSDFAVNKKEDSKGIYGNAIFYGNQFNNEKPDSFFIRSQLCKDSIQ